MIEDTDPREAIIAGLVHNRCLKPVDRIIGTSQSEFFREHDFLINFDVNAWFRAAHGGQAVFRGAESLKSSRKIIAWGGPRTSGRIGDFMIEIQLAGGGSEFVSRRGAIDRLSEQEAKEAAESMRRTLLLARNQGDPFCMSDQTRLFGPLSFVRGEVGISEKPRLIEGYRVRRYDAKLCRRYEGPRHWYAPLLYVHDLSRDAPVLLNGFVAIVTDPMFLGRCITNWAEAGFAIDRYETVSLLDDKMVDNFLGQLEASGLTAVIDPVLVPGEPPTFAGGTPFASMEMLLAQGLAGAENQD